VSDLSQQGPHPAGADRGGRPGDRPEIIGEIRDGYESRRSRRSARSYVKPRNDRSRTASGYAIDVSAFTQSSEVEATSSSPSRPAAGDAQTGQDPRHRRRPRASPLYQTGESTDPGHGQALRNRRDPGRRRRIPPRSRRLPDAGPRARRACSREAGSRRATTRASRRLIHPSSPGSRDLGGVPPGRGHPPPFGRLLPGPDARLRAGIVVSASHNALPAWIKVFSPAASRSRRLGGRDRGHPRRGAAPASRRDRRPARPRLREAYLAFLKAACRSRRGLQGRCRLRQRGELRFCAARPPISSSAACARRLGTSTAARSSYPETLAARVRAARAGESLRRGRRQVDLGDETRAVLIGDHTLYILARHMEREGRLPTDGSWPRP